MEIISGAIMENRTDYNYLNKVHQQKFQSPTPHTSPSTTSSLTNPVPSQAS